jgi:catechol 2,3-dioxygenase-like lactoylglutathione lyase family enzyme
MVQGIEHVAVVSPDTAALKDWYMEMYGGRVVFDNGNGTNFQQFPDGSMIEFVMATTEKADDVEKMAGIRHLAFSVSPKAFDEIVAKLKADDRVAEVHDVSENASGLKTYWYKDIEGNFSHLIYRPDPLI